MKVTTFTVKITDGHIRNGKRQSVLLCPVSLALYDETGKEWAVKAIGATSQTNELTWDPEVARRIRNYDNGGRMYPFSFKVTEVNLSYGEVE